MKRSIHLASNGIGLSGRKAVAEVAEVGPKPGYLSIQGAAHYASVSTRTIKRWITRGLPVYQGTLRGKVLIKPADIDAYLEKKRVPMPDVDLDAMVEDVLAGLGREAKSDTMRPRRQWART